MLEGDIWRSLWATPQAVAWEQLGWTRSVARYARMLCDFESGGDAGDMKVAAEVRQMEDRLGLSPLALLRLRWKVTEDEVAERREERVSPAKSTRRLKAVDPDALAGT
jgi:hypothetical protein